MRLCPSPPGGAPAGADSPDSGDNRIFHRAQHIWSQRPLPAGGLTLYCCIPGAKSLAVSPWLATTSQRTLGVSECLRQKGGRHRITQIVSRLMREGVMPKGQKSSLVTTTKKLSLNPLASHALALLGPKGPVQERERGREAQGNQPGPS